MPSLIFHDVCSKKADQSESCSIRSGIKKSVLQIYSYAGKVITAFDVPKAKGKVRHYVPNDPKRGTCSSLRDLLFLLYLNVSDTDLKPRLDNMRQYLSGLNNNVDPFDLIFSWPE